MSFDSAYRKATKKDKTASPADKDQDAGIDRSVSPLCVGGPDDGNPAVLNGAEFPTVTVSPEAGQASFSGVYRYDREQHVYRWFPGGAPKK